MQIKVMSAFRPDHYNILVATVKKKKKNWQQCAEMRVLIHSGWKSELEQLLCGTV